MTATRENLCSGNGSFREVSKVDNFQIVGNCGISHSDGMISRTCLDFLRGENDARRKRVTGSYAMLR